MQNVHPFFMDMMRACLVVNENPSVQKLYAEYMGEPCGEKAHHILHTSYVQRKVHDIDAWNA